MSPEGENDYKETDSRSELVIACFHREMLRGHTHGQDRLRKKRGYQQQDAVCASCVVKPFTRNFRNKLHKVTHCPCSLLTSLTKPVGRTARRARSPQLTTNVSCWICHGIISQRRHRRSSDIFVVSADRIQLSILRSKQTLAARLEFRRFSLNPPGPRLGPSTKRSS